MLMSCDWLFCITSSQIDEALKLYDVRAGSTFFFVQALFSVPSLC